MDSPSSANNRLEALDETYRAVLAGSCFKHTGLAKEAWQI